MFSVNKDKDKGCSPVSSNCVVWQGPDLEVIDLCKGDSISDVNYKLAKELLEVKEILNLSNYELNCFSDGLKCEDFSTLIQMLIERVCSLHDLTENTQNVDRTNIYVPGTNRTVILPTDAPTLYSLGFKANADGTIIDKVEMNPLFHYTDLATGDLVTQNKLVDYVSLIAARVSTNITLLQNTTQRLDAAEQAIQQLQLALNASQNSSTLPSYVSMGVFQDGVSRTLDKYVLELDRQFYEQKKSLGTPYELYQAMASFPASLGNRRMLGKDAIYSNESTWKASITKVSDLINNYNVVMMDLLTWADKIQDAIPSVCLDITYNLTVIEDPSDSTAVIISLAGSTIPANVQMFNPQDNYVKFTFDDGTTYQEEVDIFAIKANPRTIDLSSTSYASTVLLVTELNAVLIDDQNSVCQQNVHDSLVNIPLPHVTMSSTMDEVTITLIKTVPVDSYEIQLIGDDGTNYTQTVANPLDTETVVFSGLDSGIIFHALITINKNGNSTEMTSSQISTLTLPCNAPIINEVTS